MLIKHRLKTRGERAYVLDKNLFPFRIQGAQEGSYVCATVSHL